MTTDVLLVAKSDDEWPVRVIELLDRRLSVSRVDPRQGPETTADFSGVQIIVGGPSDVAHGSPSAPTCNGYKARGRVSMRCRMSYPTA